MRIKKRLLSALFATLVVLSVSSNAYAIDVKAVQFYNEALDLYVNGDTNGAILKFKSAIEIDPEFSDAYYNLGSIYRYVGKLDQAEEIFKKLLVLTPDNTSINYDLGLVYLQKDNNDKALDYLSKVNSSSEKYNDAQDKIKSVKDMIKLVSLTRPESVKPASEETKQQESSIDKKKLIGATIEEPSPEKTTEKMTEKKAKEEIVAVNYMSINDEDANKLKISPSESVNVEEEDNVGCKKAPRSSVKTVAGGFNGPTGIVRDKNGNFFVADYTANKIYKVDKDGRKTLFSSTGDINGPLGMVMDPEENIYVANYLSNSIVKINQFGETFVVATGLNKPYFLYLDGINKLYVSEQDTNTISEIKINK